ncbi:hypothetical protein [Chryseosolibacter indicus]|uniref:Uncharacterized protein n=1 Tax=Chryseosolibacter indicus TaxID=2782351 RepID=A0ABS5VNB0_9BACT|nr:hypothetical protein [Chryseosolibacter indicus]MBT1702244.1 hypothetical protein [Chryseosolibacter indicus]
MDNYEYNRQKVYPGQLQVDGERFMYQDILANSRYGKRHIIKDVAASTDEDIADEMQREERPSATFNEGSRNENRFPESGANYDTRNLHSGMPPRTAGERKEQRAGNNELERKADARENEGSVTRTEGSTRQLSD